MGDHPLVLDGELRADAKDVLDDAGRWRLPERRWIAVADAVTAMSSAARHGDVDAFRAAVRGLELCGPVRAVAIGDTPTIEAPDELRDEINELSRVVAASTSTTTTE